MRHTELYKRNKKMNRNPIILTRPKLRKTDLYLTISQHDEVKRISEEKGMTFSELFRRMVDWYLEEKYEKK